jgi:hypothetical protein
LAMLHLAGEACFPQERRVSERANSDTVDPDDDR